MATLPVPYVIRSHGLRTEAFESSKLFACNLKKIGGFNKLIFKPKTVRLRLVKRIERISHDRQILKALANSNVSAVKTWEEVATYRFRMEFGGQLKVTVVKKNNDKYGIHVEVEPLQLFGENGALIMIWGLFTANSATLMSLDSQHSSVDSQCSTTETQFVGDAVELDFEENVAPFYVSFLLKSDSGSDSKVSIIRSHRNTNFTVPVGFGAGHPSPLGVSFLDDGSVNFAFFSSSVDSVVLCLYADTTAEKPALEIDLDPYINRSGDIWHALLYSSMPFVSYGYRCRSGVGNKEHRVLLDPYAKVLEVFGNEPKKWLGKLGGEPAFDWSGEVRPNLPMEKMIVYRLNVARFTKDKSSYLSDSIAGSFSAISEKLHHFEDLGVNAILLEPVFPFDEENGPYFPWHFFSPGSLYGPFGDAVHVAKSMKEMVKTLHADGIEVLLEVVFTHNGGVGALKEIDNSSYYNIQGGEELKSRNALNCNHPIVQQLVLESLRYWVTEFHIDGFCFINASSLTRGVHGKFLSRPPLVEAIAFDPVLAKVKIVADSWDPHDMETKEVRFPHWQRWAEMNSQFSIDVKNFLRGRGLISKLATRLCGSGDLFLGGRGPAFSFNYVTRNVGFTLVDLVSFSRSELESELSWNCGEEGATNKTVVLETRLKQIRNFLFILFISLGVPVLNMGDECGQSCGGSPAYADRKPLDWNALRSGFGIQITKFISFLSSLKARRSDLLQKRSFLKEDSIGWHGAEQSPPMWDDPACKFLAMTLKGDAESSQSTSGSPNMHGDLFVAFNAADQSEKAALPPLTGDATWLLLVDTALPFPGFFSVDGVPLEDGSVTYEMKSHSCILFESRSMS
ncbi:debranching enzyme 1 [Perilla frutescens var. hirtella]|uniref:Debranching enzyme 1 n=1 Tax=Perilla frutescens var. hirtella TaxID=608512 RepID=A0AAD4ILL9_PERFH|nr:debranching enzyme 1 [Perilla frutescens var. hirtella]